MFSPAPSCCVSIGSWSSGRAAELAAPNLMLPPVGLSLDSCLGVGLLVSKFPRHPRLVWFRPVPPGIVGPREPLTCEHRRGGEEQEGIVGNGASRPAGLPLGVLENINILGDALDLQMIALHFVMQRKEVKGVPDGAPCLKVSQEVSRVYLGVYCLGIPELADPCVRDDGEHELCCLLSRGVLCSSVRAPRLVWRLEACPDDGCCRCRYSL